MGNLTDLSGKKFGRLTVLNRSGSSKIGKVTWNCLCECGNQVVAVGYSITSGRKKSCGCLHKESSISNLPKNVKPLGHERLTKKGYVVVKTESGFVRKHVLVMERHIGRKLLPGEIVHHKDENKLNNDISNLEIMLHGEHTVMHHTGARRSDATRRNISRSKSVIGEEDAEKIRERVFNGETQKSLAKAYGVGEMVISRIVRKKVSEGESWLV
jgi:hypothetical protein